MNTHRRSGSRDLSAERRKFLPGPRPRQTPMWSTSAISGLCDFHGFTYKNFVHWRVTTGQPTAYRFHAVRSRSNRPRVIPRPPDDSIFSEPLRNGGKTDYTDSLKSGKGRKGGLALRTINEIRLPRADCGQAPVV